MNRLICFRDIQDHIYVKKADLKNYYSSNN